MLSSLSLRKKESQNGRKKLNFCGSELISLP
jgi:hypothetical protein